MKIVPALLMIFGITGISNTAMSCDSVVVKMITHPYLDGPLSIEWDVENECTDSYIDEGRHLFSLDDTVLTLTYCLDSGEYRARAKCDFDFQEGMFEIVLTLNGDTIDTNEPVEFNDDDLRYYFDVYVGCNYATSNAFYYNATNNNLKMFPNPAQSGTAVRIVCLPGRILGYEVVDLLGNLVTEEFVIDNLDNPEFSSLGVGLFPGVYCINFKFLNTTSSFRLVVI